MSVWTEYIRAYRGVLTGIFNIINSQLYKARKKERKKESERVCGYYFLAKENNLLDSLREPVGAHVTPQTKNILRISIACGTNDLLSFPSTS